MLNKFFGALCPLDRSEKSDIYAALNSGKAIVTSVRDELGRTNIKYLFLVKKGHLEAYSLTGSTKEKLVLNLCALFPFSRRDMENYYSSMFANYSLLVCGEYAVEGSEKRVAVPGGNETIPLDDDTAEKIKMELVGKSNRVIFFETP